MASLTIAEHFNFLMTNRIPRRLVTRVLGRISRIESPMLARCLIRLWQWFDADLRLDESSASNFRSLNECFIRPIKPQLRPIDFGEDKLTSPCDGIVVSCGVVADGQLFQAKGMPYYISDLMPNADLADRYEGSTFVTIRLKPGFYHRFHAPIAGSIDRVEYMYGDTWNVNPIALKRIQQLYCRNERAAMEIVGSEFSCVLVPIAAVLVASLQIHGINQPLDLSLGKNKTFHLKAEVLQGQELGYFQHGSTIILFVDARFTKCGDWAEGDRINMGQSIFRLETQKERSGYEV